MWQHLSSLTDQMKVTSAGPKNIFFFCHLQAIYKSGYGLDSQCQTITDKIAREAPITIKSIWLLIANSCFALINRPSSNNQSMFVIHATARKLLKPEKKIKRNILPSVLYWGTSGYFLKKREREREREQKTGRRCWILWQLCETCQTSEGWRKSNTSPWA